MSKAPIICLDSNVFIAFLRGDEAFSNLCRQVLEEARDGKIQAVTSSLALVETVNLAGDAAEDAEQKINLLYRQSWLRLYDLTRAIAAKASSLSRKYPGGRKHNSPHDSVYVATALAAGASMVYTLDEHFISRYTNNGEGVSVCHPRSQDPQLKFKYPM
jgi:predicted nucleic acid-binding protein